LNAFYLGMTRALKSIARGTHRKAFHADQSFADSNQAVIHMHRLRRYGGSAVIREHLLLGSEQFDTVRTGCGRKPVKMGDDYVCGASIAVQEKEYSRLRQIPIMHMCGGCERSWRSICRARNQVWQPTAREGLAK
jgi:hypothetical protein